MKSKNRLIALLLCLSMLLGLMPTALAERSINISHWLDGRDLVFSWNRVEGADYYGYNFAIDGVSAYSTPQRRDSTSYRLNEVVFSYGKTIKFWVAPYYAGGSMIPVVDGESAKVQDTVTFNIPALPEEDPRSISLTYSVSGNNVRFKWTNVDDADYYCISCNINGTKVLPSTVTYDNSYTLQNVGFGDSVKFWVGCYLDDGSMLPVRDGESSKVQDTVTFTMKECPHEEYDKINYKEGWVKIDNQTHTNWRTYDAQCIACGKVYKTDIRDERTQNHVLDSNGDCTLCDYRYACEHRDTVEVERSRSIHQDNEKNHDIKITYDTVCANNNCQKVLALTSRIEIVPEAHTFQNGQCTICGYGKPMEPLNISVSRNSASAVVGDTLGATCNISGGSGNVSIVVRLHTDQKRSEHNDLRYQHLLVYRRLLPDHPRRHRAFNG